MKMRAACQNLLRSGCAPRNRSVLNLARVMHGRRGAFCVSGGASDGEVQDAGAARRLDG